MQHDADDDEARRKHGDAARPARQRRHYHRRSIGHHLISPEPPLLPVFARRSQWACPREALSGLVIPAKRSAERESSHTLNWEVWAGFPQSRFARAKMTSR